MKILSGCFGIGLVLLLIIILGSLFVAYVLPSDKNPAFDALVEKENSVFKTSMAENQEVWNRAKTYIKNQSHIVGDLESYQQTDSSLYKPYYPSNHGFQIKINRKTVADSVQFTIGAFYAANPSPVLEKEMALFMRKNIDKYSFKK